MKIFFIIITAFLMITLEIGCDKREEDIKSSVLETESEQTGNRFTDDSNDTSFFDLDKREITVGIQKAENTAAALATSCSTAINAINIDNKSPKNTFWLTGKIIGAEGTTLPCNEKDVIDNEKTIKEATYWIVNNNERIKEAGCYFKGNICVGAYVKTSEGCFGTYPIGLITAEDYKKGNEISVEECTQLFEDRLNMQFFDKISNKEENYKAWSLSKATTSAIVDTEAIYGEKLTGEIWITGNKIGANGISLPYDSSTEKIEGRIKLYHKNITTYEEAGCYIVDGRCIGAYVKDSEGNWNTYPIAIMEEVDNSDLTPEKCIKLIEDEINKW